MRRRFFTADTHFRHEGVITKLGRVGFTSIFDHDDHLIHQINNMVSKEDELYILGDLAWTDLPKIRPRIISRHVKVVLGNHDRKGQLISVFGEAPDTRMLKGFGKNNEPVFLSHYPHAFWPSSHYGSYHLYGHMHSQRESTLNKLFPQRRSLDVGVDNAKHLLGEYRPFTVDEILGILTGPGHDPVSFYRGGDESRQSSPQPGDDVGQAASGRADDGETRRVV